MKKLILISIIVACTGLHAQQVSLSITNQNLALVVESRNLTLQSGINQISLKDLPVQLDPTSVYVEFDDQRIKVLEQRFINSPVSHRQILEKSVGQSIRLLDRELGTIQGSLLSVNGNSLVIQTAEKELRLIPDYSDGHLVIEMADDQIINLFTPPTLYWSLQAEKRAEQTATLAYLTEGLNWQAIYTAILNEKEDKISLSALVSLNNTSGKTFRQAVLTLIAGQLHQVLAAAPYPTSRNQPMIEMMAKSDAGFTEETVFDYHVFRLGKKIDLDHQQTKEISLFPSTEADVNKIYKYNFQKNNKNVTVHLTLQNSRQNGLGLSLPAGTVRLFKRASNELLILGEDRISNTSDDEMIDLEIGNAFDIIAERKVIEQRRDSNNSEKMKVAIELRNRKDEDISVNIIEPLIRNRNVRILSSNYKVSHQDASQIEFIIPITTGQSATLNFEILSTW